MIQEFIGFIDLGIAFHGEIFDIDNDIYAHSDAIRYAIWIQEARDRNDYVRADEVRSFVEKFGIVRSSRDRTMVVLGDITLDRHSINLTGIPEYTGGFEWVSPDKVNGRQIIETAYEYMSDVVHSYRVRNWEDHPNLEIAKEMKLPIQLWTKQGQMTLEKSASVYWFFDQLKKIETVQIEQWLSEQFNRNI